MGMMIGMEKRGSVGGRGLAGESARRDDGLLGKGPAQGFWIHAGLHKGPGQLITASFAGEPTLSTSVTLVIHFLKASSALAPTLIPVSSRHLCTPRQNHGVVVSGPSEDPDQTNGDSPYSFALGPNPTVQRDWRLYALNGVWWGKAGRLWPRQGGVALGSEMPFYCEGGAGPKESSPQRACPG